MGRQTDNKHGRGLWKVHVLAPKTNIMAGVLKRRVRAHVSEVVACMFLQLLSEYRTISQWEPLISLAGGRKRRTQNAMNYSQYLLWYKLISLGGKPGILAVFQLGLDWQKWKKEWRGRGCGHFWVGTILFEKRGELRTLN